MQRIDTGVHDFEIRGQLNHSPIISEKIVFNFFFFKIKNYIVKCNNREYSY